MCVGGGDEGANIAQFIPGPLVNLSSCTIYSSNVYTIMSLTTERISRNLMFLHFLIKQKEATRARLFKALQKLLTFFQQKILAYLRN